MRVRPRSCVLVLALACIAGVGVRQSVAGTAVSESGLQDRPMRRGAEAAPPDVDAAPRRFAGEDERREGRATVQRRRLSPEQIDAIVDVASEVFPDGGSRLREMRERDPAALEGVLGRQARRLFALAMLRQRNPELYTLKVEELRNQMELRTLAAQREELSEEDESGAASRRRIEARIRAIAERQVDLGLRVRGLELAAMDEAINRMRAELAEDARERDAAIAEMVDLVLSGRQLPTSDIRPDSGPRGVWGGRERPGRPDREEIGGSDRRPRGGPDRDAPPPR